VTFRLLLAGLLLALAACVGNGQPGPARDTVPMPELDDGLRSLGSGVLDIALDPGQTRDLDPLNMAINLGITPPACADFVLAFTWGLRLPNPAGDAKVGFAGERMGGRFEVAAAAPSGSATIGCALLQAVNESRVPVVVQLRFVVASSRR
jgi:hypothetical protein